MGLVISRHGVASDSDSGLSPLQTVLLNCSERVRIASAPTGAGKSYVFQRAMMDRGERILFVVPTRRLAQNLRFGLVNNLRAMGWDFVQAREKVSVWSSDTKEELLKAGRVAKGGGKISITGFRVREIYELDDTREAGEIIFAIPEVVSGILLRGNFLGMGQSDAGIVDLLTQFDHIVFDEFHTIHPRGFGMAAVLAKLVTTIPCRAKISFLSATPLDIENVLLKLEVPEEEIKFVEEDVSSESGVGIRTIHGDVVLEFKLRGSLADLIAESVDEIEAELQAGRLVVVIYNNLGNLQRQCGALAAILDNLGVSRDERLLINSIDDTRQGEEFEIDFAVGRLMNPQDFKVLIATSSVEMGVTFNTRLLFMEPGFEPLNFLQRYGRAARGEVEGKVIVRWDEGLSEKMRWLRQLLNWASLNDGKRLSIQDLSNKLRCFVTELFEDLPDEPAFFGHLSNRAKWTAGLYWYLLQKQESNNKYVKDRLYENLPEPARIVAACLSEVRKMEKDSEFGEAAKKWCDGFVAEAKVLRNMERRIKVVEGNGNSLLVGENFLRRETDVLEQGLLRLDEEGNLEVQIGGSFCLRDRGRYVPPQKWVRFPYKPQRSLLECKDYELIDKWCEELMNPMESYIWSGYEESIKAAERLVRLTGLVVSDDDDAELDADSGVL
jgi:CRISPR/Cas system-associated endonuclease/helicase Cas3